METRAGGYLIVVLAIMLIISLQFADPVSFDQTAVSIFHYHCSTSDFDSSACRLDSPSPSIPD
jgi:hypothetical protein